MEKSQFIFIYLCVGADFLYKATADALLDLLRHYYPHIAMNIIPSNHSLNRSEVTSETATTLLDSGDRLVTTPSSFAFTAAAASTVAVSPLKEVKCEFCGLLNTIDSITTTCCKCDSRLITTTTATATTSTTTMENTDGGWRFQLISSPFQRCLNTAGILER